MCIRDRCTFSSSLTFTAALAASSSFRRKSWTIAALPFPDPTWTGRPLQRAAPSCDLSLSTALAFLVDAAEGGFEPDAAGDSTAAAAAAATSLATALSLCFLASAASLGRTWVLSASEPSEGVLVKPWSSSVSEVSETFPGSSARTL